MKTFISTLILLGLSILSAQAQVDPVYSQELIDRWEGKHVEHSSNGRSTTSEERVFLTPMIIELNSNWNKLTDDAKSYFRTATSRPSISGERTYSTSNFLVHYSTTDSKYKLENPTYTTSSQTPDYIINVGKVLEYVMAQYKSVNYPAPPSDGSAGGSNQYDVYVINLDNYSTGSITGQIYGFVMPEGDFKDNPNTPEREISARSSWIAMRTDYSFGNPSASESLKQKRLEVTAAHEFFHSIQFGYAAYDINHLSLVEGTATSMEDQIYPQHRDNFQYMNTIFKNTGVSLYANTRANERDDFQNREYGTWLFFKLMREYYGNSIIRKMFETFRNKVTPSSLPKTGDVLFTTLRNNNSNLEEFIDNWFVANVVLKEAPSSVLNTYSDASRYNVYLNLLASKPLDKVYTKSMNFTKAQSENNSIIRYKLWKDFNPDFQPIGANYFRLTSDTNFVVTAQPFTSMPFESLRLILVKYYKNGNVAVVKGSSVSNLYKKIEVSDNSLVSSYSLIIGRTDTDNEQMLNDTDYYFTIGKEASYVASNDDDKQSTTITAFPSPFTNSLTVNTSTIGNFKGYLIDLRGNALAEAEITAGNKLHFAILNNLPAGIYFLKIVDNAGNIYIEKVMKR